jgi:type I restriction enzyme, S subunit
VSFPSYELYKESGVVRIGRVPSAWQVVHLKRVAVMIYGDALPSNERVEDGSVPVFGSNGQFALHDRANTEAPVIFVGRKGSCGALTWNDVPSFGIDTVYFVDDRHVRGNLRWLFWALQTLGFDAMSQDTGVPGLAREVAYSTMLPVASKSEQAAIADFLDRETAKIDALIAEQERLIALLKEKRQAVISHAVTKGLDPNAPMKDSGVEWFGEVPAHWRTGCLSRIAERVVVGIAEAAVHAYATSGIPILRSTNIRAGKIVGDLLYVMPEYSAERETKLIRAGDLVTVRTGHAGVTAVIPDTLDGCQCFTMLITTVDGNQKPEFFCYWLNSPSAVGYFAIEAWGSAQPNISVPILKAIPVPIPPKDEQVAIVAYLNGRLTQFDRLVAEAENAIVLLQERRSALISAAVTGKIDVRNLAPASAEAA